MQPQQGQMVQGFTDPQTTAQPTMVGGQHVLTVPQQSPAPTWMGVITILWGLMWFVSATFVTFNPDWEGMMLVREYFHIFASIMFCVGGYFTFTRKKIGPWISLATIGLLLLMDIIITVSISSEVDGAAGQFCGGLFIIPWLILHSFCALMVSIPVMATGSNLE